MLAGNACRKTASLAGRDPIAAANPRLADQTDWARDMLYEPSVRNFGPNRRTSCPKPPGLGFGLALLVLALVGCGDRRCKSNQKLHPDDGNPPAPPDTAPAPDTGVSFKPVPFTGTWQECTRPSLVGDPRGNGRQLLGIGVPVPNPPGDPLFMEVESIDTDNVTDKDGKPIGAVVVRNQELTGSITRNGVVTAVTGAGWIGASLTGWIRCRSNAGTQFKVTLHITAASVPVRTGPPDQVIGDLGGHAPPFQFALELDDPAGTSTTRPACAWPSGTANTPRKLAFPVPGHWGPAANYIPGSDALSFACADDAVVKCLQEGYMIHDDGAGPHDKDTDKEALFKACTRVVRADYCGYGISFTRDGTKVEISDTSGTAHDPVDPALAFEGAWNSHGMFCLGHLRYAIPDSSAWQDKADCVLDPKPPAAPMKLCDSEQKARELNGDQQPLIFSTSCPSHPCSGEASSLKSL